MLCFAEVIFDSFPRSMCLIYSYSLGFLHCQWGSHKITHVSRVIRKDMGKTYHYQTATKQNKEWDFLWMHTSRSCCDEIWVLSVLAISNKMTCYLDMIWYVNVEYSILTKSSCSNLKLCRRITNEGMVWVNKVIAYEFLEISMSIWILYCWLVTL